MPITTQSADFKAIVASFDVQLSTSVFFRQVQAGQVSPQQVGNLLESIRYLLVHTPIHLRIAFQKAQSSHFSELAPYYLEHIRYEVDHDQWATNDLRKLKSLYPKVDSSVTVAMLDWVRTVETWVRKDACLYLPYILFVEYFACTFIPPIVKELVNRCGFPIECFTVFTNHAELDGEHADHDCQVIDGILKQDPSYAHRFSAIAYQTADLYLDFLNELATPILLPVPLSGPGTLNPSLDEASHAHS